MTIRFVKLSEFGSEQAEGTAYDSEKVQLNVSLHFLKKQQQITQVYSKGKSVVFKLIEPTKIHYHHQKAK